MDWNRNGTQMEWLWYHTYEMEWYGLRKGLKGMEREANIAYIMMFFLVLAKFFYRTVFLFFLWQDTFGLDTFGQGQVFWTRHFDMEKFWFWHFRQSLF